MNSWYEEWYATAERVRGIADDGMAAGHEVSAREAYLRASTYYAIRVLPARRPHRSAHQGEHREEQGLLRPGRAIVHSPMEPVSIPYEDTALPGYFYAADGTGTSRPTIIIQTGFDGTQKELYSGGAAAALRRGYNCLTFEGPGQGEASASRAYPSVTTGKT
ncbi:MAG: hypothetical protein AB1384_12800 [Actinomycetota bacterium]